MFFGGLPKRFTKDDLKNLVSPFGNTNSVKIMINLKTGESMCYGFVDFCSQESADMAIKKLDERIIWGKKIHLKYAISSEKYGKRSKTIFAKSLPLYYNDNDIYKLFSKAGRIVSLRAERNYTSEKKIRGYYIQFESEEDAYQAIQKYDNTKVVENGWPLFIRFSDEILVPEGNTGKENAQKKNMQIEIENLSNVDIFGAEEEDEFSPNSWYYYLVE